jgi:GH15 family glucan-1,4-alpha-glucosidase
MALRIEDYALIGDTQTAALVGKNGAIDWACFPRFDSGAVFAALLGDESNGHWTIAPAVPIRHVRRRYLERSLILETEYTTEQGTARVLDFMPIRGEAPDICRIVEGVQGRVPFRMQLCTRFSYGRFKPLVRRRGEVIALIAGSDALFLKSDVALTGAPDCEATFEVEPGTRASFTLTWHPSHQSPPLQRDAVEELQSVREWWSHWFERCTYHGEWQEAVNHSLAVLKAMTFEPTGAIIAAPTTSLPEAIGGTRNWDYRYCWLRDATLTLDALLRGGYHVEARAWREWLVRAVGGDARQLQIVYGAAGERWLTERHAHWLRGYEGSRPVRVGNAAEEQLQLDVYGELMDAFSLARRAGIPPQEDAWDLQRGLLDHLESIWTQQDKGIWEMRGPARHFTYSKVMCWVAVDRGIKAVERSGLSGPLERWRALRDQIHAEICAKAYDSRRNTFVQFYGAKQLDASLLQIALLGFLPADDPRVSGTIAAIERDLMEDGLVRRYGADTDDGLKESEGAFLACSFWLADNYVLSGRLGDARKLFERLLSLRNDVGLLSEEYDPRARRLVGNFPQAFSHVALVNTALNLARGGQGVRVRGAD